MNLKIQNLYKQYKSNIMKNTKQNECSIIKVVDKTSKIFTLLLLPFFIWVFYQVIINA